MGDDNSPVRKEESKVVMAKLSRDEFSRFQHYLEINGETVNAAIKRLILNEVDKPSLQEILPKSEVIGVMFDTNSFDKILTGEIPLDLIKRSINKGYRYFVTHIQIDELSNTPDTKKDKRAQLILFLSAVAPSLIPSESFVLGYSRLGFAKLGTAGYYEKLLNENKTNIKDAIIGETAIKNNFILITEDKNFIKKMESLGGIILTPENYTKKLRGEK